MIEGEIAVPDEIECTEQVFDIAFHTQSNVLAAGLIDGTVEIWRYNTDSENVKLSTFSHHQASCRGVLIAEDGHMMFTISKDKSLKGIDTSGSVVMNYENAHSEPINKIITIPNIGLATGDDSGCIKIWDIRSPTPTMSFHLHEDFVSG